MKFSVVINNYNYANFLAECVDSVLLQDYPHVEVIVVDDGSTDGSRDIISSYGNAILPVLKRNGGQASAFNAGFDASTGDVVLLLDADDAFLPGKLSLLADIYAVGEQGWCFDQVVFERGSKIRLPIRTRVLDARRDLAEGKFADLPVPTSGLSFRKELLSKILPMPTARDVVLSDNYLKFAAAFLDKGVIIDTPLTYQRIHSSNRYTSNNRSVELRCNIMFATGIALARRYPGLSRLGRELAMGGLAESRRSLISSISEISRCANEPALRSGVLELTGAFLKKRAANRVRRFVNFYV